MRLRERNREMLRCADKGEGTKVDAEVILPRRNGENIAKYLYIVNYCGLHAGVLAEFGWSRVIVLLNLLSIDRP